MMYGAALRLVFLFEIDCDDHDLGCWFRLEVVGEPSRASCFSFLSSHLSCL